MYKASIHFDGMISSKDAEATEVYVCGRNNNQSIDADAADVDLDGKISLRDAEIIFQFKKMK